LRWMMETCLEMKLGVFQDLILSFVVLFLLVAVLPEGVRPDQGFLHRKSIVLQFRLVCVCVCVCVAAITIITHYFLQSGFW
jgi:hypothetical protein